MKSLSCLSFLLVTTVIVSAQNVGIGTTTPRGPLSFPATTGQKIILWDDGNAAGDNYGIGVSPGRLLIHSYTAVDNIAFGYGSSTNFNERMRLINTGSNGMLLYGKLAIASGNTSDPSASAGIFFYKPDNSITLGYFGGIGSQYIGLVGTPSTSYGLLYDVVNNRVGINNTSPLATLHVGDGTVLFTGSISSTPIPASTSQVKLIWHPSKAAFRAGVITNNNWDTDSVGTGTFAINYNSKAKGDYSIALGYESQSIAVSSVAINYRSSATGDYSMAIGPETVASGLSAISLGAQTIASGGNAVAIGSTSVASQDFAVAIGRYATATNFSAVSLGEKNTVSGAFAFGTGLNSKISGDYAAAFGNMSFAKAAGSFTAGLFNDSTDSPITTSPQPGDRIFQLGNGTADNARSNAVTVLRNGSALFTAPAILPVTPGVMPAVGPGNRMMWYADKAAFRAGNTVNDSWDKDKIGVASFAAGSSTQASGITSFAVGNFTYAIGDGSSALGFSVMAKAKGATSVGIYNEITDAPSPSVESPTDRLFQIGNGADNLSRSNAITVLRNGYTGIGNINPATRLDVTGVNNWDLTNTEGDFRIGNGSYRIKMGIALAGGGAGAATIRSAGGIERLNLGANNTNLLTLNGATGMVGIGTETPSQKLHVIGNILASGTITPSDARFKKYITAIASPLDKIQQLNGVTYFYRTNEFPANGFDNTLQVGVIAQDVEKIFPQLVFSDDKGYKAVDYPKLIPLLIEGMKEQQKQITAQQQQIDDLNKLVQQLIKKQ